MAGLTLEQRARRNSTRKNNRTKKQYPLLAQAGVIEDWMIRPDEEAHLLQAQEEYFQAWLRRKDAFEKKQKAEAQEMRLQVAELVSEEELARLDDRRAMLPKTSAYSADFWSRMLKDLGVEVVRKWPCAFGDCPWNSVRGCLWHYPDDCELRNGRTDKAL